MLLANSTNMSHSILLRYTVLLFGANLPSKQYGAKLQPSLSEHRELRVWFVPLYWLLHSYLAGFCQQLSDRTPMISCRLEGG